MIARAFKLRFRRRLRLRKRQVEELGQQAEQQLERNFFRRLERLVDVRRFIIGWMLLLVLLGSGVVAQARGLNKYYQTLGPLPGGRYTEGMLGSYTNANPLYATSPVDEAVSELIFAGLFTYDEKNKLIGDLASHWSVDARGTTYTVHLKPGLTWHDGKRLTADDVVFTYQVIQNPDAKSPLNPSWQGITVTAVDPNTITFTLPNVLSSFPYSLTNGIVPKHILANESMSALRTLPFNTSQSIGAGPFKMAAIDVTGGSVEDREEHISLQPFEKYHGGAPKLDRFVFRSFRNEDRMVDSFRKHELTAMSGLTQEPEGLLSSGGVRSYNLLLTGAVMSFFNTTTVSDVNVRQALVRATDTEAIFKSLGYPTLPVRQPLLQGQLGYNPAYSQASFDLSAASELLDRSGWVVGKDGLRFKDGQSLRFDMHFQDSDEYAKVARLLKSQWREVGVQIDTVSEDTSDFQTSLSKHTYDILLYGISIGEDPDVYVYWDSKQFDFRSNRLNFSEWRSPTADAALQAGRTRLDPTLRVVKYQPFLQAWQMDAPAIGLYQPRSLYITHGQVYGLGEYKINSEIGRFRNVHNWMIRERGVSQTDTNSAK